MLKLIFPVVVLFGGEGYTRKGFPVVQFSHLLMGVADSGHVVFLG